MENLYKLELELEMMVRPNPATMVAVFKADNGGWHWQFKNAFSVWKSKVKHHHSSFATIYYTEMIRGMDTILDTQWPGQDHTSSWQVLSELLKANADVDARSITAKHIEAVAFRTGDLLIYRNEMEENGGFLSHRGTPSHHPFLDGIFPNKNQPTIYLHLWEPPLNDDF